MGTDSERQPAAEHGGLCVGFQRILGSYENYQPRAFIIEEAGGWKHAVKYKVPYRL